MPTTKIDDDKIEIVYTDDSQLAVYPDHDLDRDGFVAQEQARYAGHPVPDDIVRRYFWWYRFLLLNKDYAECCKVKGQGSLYKTFYDDWGDIFALPFSSWWKKRGRKIAGLKGWFVKDVSNEPSLKPYADRPDCLLVAVDLDAPGSRKTIYGAVTDIVRSRLGQRAKAGARSRHYEPEQCDYHLLKWAYEVYVSEKSFELDEVRPKRTEIAKRANLPSTEMKPGELEDARQRARKEGDIRKTAKQIISNALELGRFPVHDRRKRAPH